jgi:hypothetical protein
MLKPRTGLTILLLAASAMWAVADTTVQTLPFTQDWTNTGLIPNNDTWGTPGIHGYLGDSDPTGSVTNVDPRTLTADVAVRDTVFANQANASLISGGVGEFELANPVVALQGSGTADAPFIRLHVNTTGADWVNLRYVLRDIDDTADNSAQQVNAQYRVGNSGPWTNIAGTYVADATLGPSLAGLETPIKVTLPSNAANQPEVQIRIMTTNAGGNDEWVGIDNIVVEADVPLPGASPMGLAALALLLAGGAVTAFAMRRRVQA